MSGYHRFTGGRADQILPGMLTTPAAVQETIGQYADLGVDEVMLYCYGHCYGRDPEQVERLADAL
jgi:hypothetical protein